ncbi:aldo/keto reductase [Methylophilaceae bacterium]|nr:aldo/keto reductase [Methylophilaceae bacterium]|tara:strand:+ start:243 stop:1148 length:906 start_codon:yes stop_codon:yes gene_type:complete
MSNNYIHKLGLGTVQFGLDYGISNLSGQTSTQGVKEILQCALQNNITTIDTANTYGTSEEAIGLFNNDSLAYNIVTKTIPINKEIIHLDDLKIVRDGVAQSLKRLKQNRLYGLLLHHADDLKSKNGKLLYSILNEYKADGVFSKIGVSVYSAEQIDFVLDHFEIDLIQLPMNVFDQRLIHSGALKRLQKYGVEIHVRSAFLQGLVFMDDKKLPNHLQCYSSHLTEFHRIVKKLGCSPASASLAFLMQQPEIDKVICGVNSLIQFQELIDTVSALPNIEKDVFDAIGFDDVSFLNPSNWNAL